jgi:DNA-binding FadR family transcriptional regulator
VQEHIRLHIQREQLRPGDRLPSEETLAASLGVGRPVVREAMKGLEAIGVVEIKPGSGTFVDQFDPYVYVQHFTRDLLVEGLSLRELSEVRCLVEVAFIRDAVERLTEDDLAELRALWAKMETHALTHSPYIEDDFRIHRHIFRHVENRLIDAMLDALYALHLVLDPVEFPDEVIERDLAAHRELVEAVLARDGAAARRSLSRHFEVVAKRQGFSPAWRQLDVDNPSDS